MLETLERRSERPRRRSRRGLVILLALFLLLVGVVAAGGAYYEWAVGASGPQTPIVLTIPAGATGSDVAKLLKDNGVIRSSLAFKLRSKFGGFSGGFEAGRYRLTTNMRIDDVLQVLKKGPFVDTLRVTFPEGYTVKQVAARAHEKLPISRSDFVASATSGKWTLGNYLPSGTKTVEGFLFPSTYDFFKDAKADDVITRVLQEFDKQAQSLPWTTATKLGVTNYEVVIVASLIEREAKFDTDRPHVAAVIYNRLKKGMALQFDSTIQYALGSPKLKLTFKELQVDSPYNTYLHTGLPPTPIDSPGVNSLAAALAPSDAGYLYFVADSNGHDHFTSSYQEFLTLKKKYLG